MRRFAKWWLLVVSAFLSASAWPLDPTISPTPVMSATPTTQPSLTCTPTPSVTATGVPPTNTPTAAPSSTATPTPTTTPGPGTYCVYQFLNRNGGFFYYRVQMCGDCTDATIKCEQEHPVLDGRCFHCVDTATCYGHTWDDCTFFP